MTSPLTARRQVTRQRLIDAAFTVFAREGFGRATVEKVCDEAGFSRGAFYSNFTSLDELFLAIWEQRAAQMRTELAGILSEDLPEVLTIREAVEYVLPLVPVEDEWYRVTAEFTAHALRNPPLRAVMEAREEAILAALMPILTDLLAHLGRVITDPDALGPALIAVHDGTSVQCLIESDAARAHARRADLFTLLVESHTEERPT